MDNYVINMLGFNNRARIVFSESTNMIQSLQGSINIEASVGQALTELITTMCLLSGLLDGQQRIVVKLTGDTSNKFLIASTEANGSVRGFASDSFTHTKPISKKSLGIFGQKGFVSVQRDSGMFNTYTGLTDMKYGSIAKNIEYYYKQSEQLPTFICIFVSSDENSKIIVSRGLMLQLLPSESKTLIKKFVSEINAQKAFFNDASTSIDFDVLKNLLPIDLKLMSIKPLNYRCGCTKEQYYGIIFSLSPREIDEIISQKQTLNALCNTCGKNYTFDWTEIAQLFGLPEII